MGRLRPSGGYRRAISFQTATVIYDGTYWFCEAFLDKHSRTVDQMVQAARSGRQNIAEGSRASGSSSQTELRLVNVARASLEELLLDFEDFLRQHHMPQWRYDSPEADAVRHVPAQLRNEQADARAMTDLSDAERWALYAPWLEHQDPAVRANALICLINQAIICLISKSGNWKRHSWRRAAIANNLLRHEWQSDYGRTTALMPRARRFRLVHFAVR